MVDSNLQANLLTFKKEMMNVINAADDLQKGFSRIKKEVIAGRKEIREFNKELAKQASSANLHKALARRKRDMIEAGLMSGQRLIGGAKAAYLRGGGAERAQALKHQIRQSEIKRNAAEIFRTKYGGRQQASVQELRALFLNDKMDLREFADSILKIGDAAKKAGGVLRTTASGLWKLKKIGIGGMFGMAKQGILPLAKTALRASLPLVGAGAVGAGIGGTIGALTNKDSFNIVFKDFKDNMGNFTKGLSSLLPIYAHYKLLHSKLGRALIAATFRLGKFGVSLGKTAAAIHEHFMQYEAILSTRFGQTNVGQFKSAIMEAARNAGMPFAEAMGSFNLATAVPSSRELVWDQEKQQINQSQLEELMKTIQAVRLTQPDVAARFGMMWPNIVSGDERSFRHAFETGVDEMAKTIKLTNQQQIKSESQINRNLRTQLSQTENETSRAILTQGIEQSNQYLKNLVEQSKNLPSASDYRSGDPKKVMGFMAATGRTYLGERERGKLAGMISLQIEQAKSAIQDMIHTITGQGLGDQTGEMGIYDLIQMRIRDIVDTIFKIRGASGDVLVNIRKKAAEIFQKFILTPLDTLAADFLASLNPNASFMENFIAGLSSVVGSLVNYILKLETYLIAAVQDFFLQLTNNNPAVKAIFDKFIAIWENSQSLVNSFKTLTSAASSAAKVLEGLGFGGKKGEKISAQKAVSTAIKDKSVSSVEGALSYLKENLSGFEKLDSSSQRQMAQLVMKGKGFGAYGIENKILGGNGIGKTLLRHTFGTSTGTDNEVNRILEQSYEKQAAEKEMQDKQQQFRQMRGQQRRAFFSTNYETRRDRYREEFKKGNWGQAWEAALLGFGIDLSKKVEKGTESGTKKSQRMLGNIGFQRPSFNFGNAAAQARTLVADHMKRYGDTIALKFGDAVIHIVDGRPIENKLKLRPRRAGEKRGKRRAERRSKSNMIIDRRERRESDESQNETIARPSSGESGFSRYVKAAMGAADYSPAASGYLHGSAPALKP